MLDFHHTHPVADSGFEELFVRVVPVEVCCTHHSSNGGGGSNSGGGGSNVNMPAAKNIHHCLRAQAAASHASERFYPDSPSHASAAAAAGAPMPGTPPNPGAGGLNPSGLYPTLSSAEMQTCFCPNCCSNTYTAADGFSFNGRPESSTLQPGPSSADGGMAAAAVAVQRITVRVLAQKSRYGANGRLLPGCFKMELSSDSSLFFLFLCTITEGAFQDIKVCVCVSLHASMLAHVSTFTEMCGGTQGSARHNSSCDMEGHPATLPTAAAQPVCRLCCYCCCCCSCCHSLCC